MRPSAPAGSGRRRAPTPLPSPSYVPGRDQVKHDRASWPDDDVERPIAGHLGPGTVIACAVEPELWPAWTDAIVFAVGKGGRS
jgi:hypothetical protein